MSSLIEIENALDRKDLPGAAELAVRAMALGIQEPLVFNLVAWRHEEDNELEKAEAVTRQALAHWPRDPSLHLALGVVLRKSGRMRDAVLAFESAIKLDSRYPAAWFERGATFERGGALTDAAKDFRRALALEPGNAAAHAALASNLARSGKREEATRHAHEALRIEPQNVAAHNALALIAIEEKRFSDAVALIEPIVDTVLDSDAAVNLRSLLGDAYEGVGRYDDAYQAYATAQERFYATNLARIGEGFLSALDVIETVGDALEATDPALWQDAAPATGVAATHVFLTGYPRSGTTLVENILATLPGAVAIEERRTLSMIDRDYFERKDGLSRFAALPAPEIEALRAAYWEKASEAAQEPLAGKLFIDMDPFKAVHLPVIAKLFPAAKVVLMRRDPRDVVWSCFHTNFAFNPGTMAFATLDSTARHYALTQRVTERSLATLPLDVFELRYEALVQDFEATTQALCAFLGVDWSADLRRFDRTAERRGVSTASTTQVRRGLYDGSGGWRRYERQLAAVEPILGPWIEKLGYA